MRFIRLDSSTASAWDAIAADSDDAWLFHGSAWLFANEAVWGFLPRSFLAEADGRFVGIFPLQCGLRVKRLSSTFMGASGPAVVRGVSQTERRDILAQMFDHAESIGRADKCERIDVFLPVLAASNLRAARENPLVAFGYEDMSTCSLVAELRGGFAVDAAFSADARYQARKASRAGYTVATVSSRDEIDRYYAVHCDTYRRTSTQPHSKAYFYAIYDCMVAAGHAAIWKALAPSGEAVAFQIIGRYRDTAHYWAGCCASAHLNSGVNYMIQAHAMADARAHGCVWFENGEIFPGAVAGKLRGLTVFKSKFGGTPRAFFKGKKHIGRSWLGGIAAVLFPSQAVAVGAVKSNKQLYEHAYEVAQVSVPAQDDYFGRLTGVRCSLIRRIGGGKRVLDLCCGSGDYLLRLRGDIVFGLGIDFVHRFVAAAEGKNAGSGPVCFTVADACRIPVRDECFDVVYSFASLYSIPDLAGVMREIRRVLKPGGYAVFDLGNRCSLNAVVCRAYGDSLVQVNYQTVGGMQRLIHDAGLRIESRHAFQLFPLWGDRPRWLLPILHPVWKRLLAIQVSGKMLDEWISNLPIMNRFAFRQLFVCRKD